MPKATAKVKRDARDLVRIRDGHRCLRCGRSIVDYPSNIHHRRPKGAGGSALLETPSNLARLCGNGNSSGCHGIVERRRAEARIQGWLIPKLSDDNPTQVPLLTYLGWVLLDDDGGSIPYEAAS